MDVDTYITICSTFGVKGLTFPRPGFKKKKRLLKVVLSVSLATVALVGLSVAAYVLRQIMKISSHNEQGSSIHVLEDDIEIPLFCFTIIAEATNNFSSANKLGEGGFGAVYKGILGDGQEIAVKRLSKASRQGVDELKNEVGCIAKLQHRNLVKLLGYCNEADESLLVYEYMPNKSLDSFLFDESLSSTLEWRQRFQIIHGIARGLLYLHQDSRLRVIHRDLKAGNVLLDHDMNPKISDFGIARMFRGNESEANTKRVVGTFGYIAPEYAANGIFSVKSDVFSFGVLVLEIVTGRKNRTFSHEEQTDSLLGHVWRLFNVGRSLELVIASTRTSYIVSEAQLSIHIGLLCVQHGANDRPTMSSVVSMLYREGMLPPPKRPAYVSDEISPEHMSQPGSINEITITSLNAR